MVNVRIIRMRKVPFIDSTGLNNLRNLWKRSKKENIQIVLSGVSNGFGALEKLALLTNWEDKIFMII